MTKREAAIVTAYTGKLIGDIGALYEYLTELFGRPVYTHELPGLWGEIKKRSKQEFVDIQVE